jgi:hypothetical protein
MDMKTKLSVTMLVCVLLSASVFAHPWHRGPYCSHYYYRPVHGRYVGFGFGYGGFSPFYYAAPPPIIYYPAPVVVPPPVVVQPPVAVQPSPPTSEPSSNFVETNRRFHQHGDNTGKIDWVEGLLNGRPVRIYYDDFGRVLKQKWVD